MKKVVLATLVIGLYASIFAYDVYASDRNIRVQLDNQDMLFTEAKPYIDKRGRVLVPLKLISESMGAEVKWDSLSKTSVIIKDDKSINVGEEAVISSDRTMVPIRFVSEALGAKVVWDKQAYAVIITTDGSEPVTSLESTKLTGNTDIPSEVFKNMLPNLQKMYKEGHFNNDRFGTDLTQPESVLNAKGLLSARQSLLVAQIVLDPKTPKNIELASTIDYYDVPEDAANGNSAILQLPEQDYLGKYINYKILLENNNVLSNNILHDRDTYIFAKAYGMQIKDNKFRVLRVGIRNVCDQFFFQLDGGTSDKIADELLYTDWMDVPDYWN